MRKILFLTGTRADFGKLKPLISTVEEHKDFECFVFVTGMHQLQLYGKTADEVVKSGYKNIHHFINQFVGEPMEMILANTISGLSKYVHENRPDMIVIHGDRVEALAGAIVGMIQNIKVAHIEGGERSGTVDEMLRHAVSKMSHLHFVANEEAATRVTQMGEKPANIYVIGSPDIDIMCSKNLPSLEETKQHYGINFDKYAIVMFHPVTTEINAMEQNANQMVDALLKDKKGNYVVIYPNNDEGTHHILNAYERLKNNPRFRVFPSIRFERFLKLLKSAEFCLGNSSAGMREAPFYGIPTINIGTRQKSRFKHETIIDCDYNTKSIKMAVDQARKMEICETSHHFGDGNSATKFMEAITSESLWETSQQKKFYDIPYLFKRT